LWDFQIESKLGTAQRQPVVNLFTAIDRTQAAIEVMRETDTGSIVFIASDAAFGEIRQAHLASC